MRSLKNHHVLLSGGFPSGANPPERELNIMVDKFCQFFPLIVLLFLIFSGFVLEFGTVGD
jgi:hypothetical protein